MPAMSSRTLSEKNHEGISGLSGDGVGCGNGGVGDGAGLGVGGISDIFSRFKHFHIVS